MLQLINSMNKLKHDRGKILSRTIPNLKGNFIAVTLKSGNKVGEKRSTEADLEDVAEGEARGNSVASVPLNPSGSSGNPELIFAYPIQNPLLELSQVLPREKDFAISQKLFSEIKSFEVILIESNNEEDPKEDPEEELDPKDVSWLDDITYEEEDNQEEESPKIEMLEDYQVKREDPWSFVLTIDIGDGNSLIDTEAIMNILVSVLYNPSRLPTLQHVKCGLVLADQSIVHPLGLCEDVIIDFGGCPVMTDFLVMEMKP